MRDVSVRSATPDDAESLLAIYRPVVLNTAISFELEPPSVEEFRGRIERSLGKWAWLVAERGRRPLGYAYATPHRSRGAYQWSVEPSVYVDDRSHRQGVGTMLYEALLPIARRHREFQTRRMVSRVRLGPRPLKSNMQEQVAQPLPAREGHFVFESGHHGQLWLDLELLFLHPERLRPLAEALADRLRGYRAAAVCEPLVEGAFVGLMVASSLRLPFSYSEPVRDHRAAGLFPVSYPVPKPLQPGLRGKRVAIVNDVINAGSAVRGTLASLKRCGAQPVAIGALAVYGPAASELAATHDVALEALASFPSRIWEPGTCPLCARGVPLNES
jgi:orotate phosphoribosyltransferase